LAGLAGLASGSDGSDLGINLLKLGQQPCLSLG
jgi:hypothetical protein